MYYPFILIWHCSVACIVKSQAFSLRHQEQVCLRRHTQRHGVRSTLQRCMKHAHIITHSSTHAVCLLFFTRKWGAWPSTTFWLTPDKVAEEFSVCCHCYGTVSYGIAVSPPKFNYHLRLLVANTPPIVLFMLSMCVCVSIRPEYVILISNFFLSLKAVHTNSHNYRPKTPCWYRMRLCHLKREKGNAAILA